MAVSGGADSVALLHYMRAQAAAFGFQVVAVHCEHGIRGEDSLQDAAFVVELCKRWGVTLYSFSEDCLKKSAAEKTSLETAARIFRYGCFERLLKSKKCDFIALAHHENDEAETVLFRICRGTSLTGAAAMKEISGAYIRPFLTWSKDKILNYIKKNALSYRDDKTNFEPCATRNKLRLLVMPALEKVCPNASENLAKFAFAAAEDDEILYELAEKYVLREKKNSLSDTGVRLRFCEKKPLFFRACLLVLKELGVTVDYTREHLNAVYALQESQTGASIRLQKGIVAKREYDKIVFYDTRVKVEADESFCKPFALGCFTAGGYVITVTDRLEEVKKRENGAFKRSVLRFDGDKIASGAAFRFRKEGDTFKRYGGGEKPLKKYFIDEKIPSWQRDRLPVLAVGSKALLVCGADIADEIKIDGETKNVLYLTIEEE